MSWLVFAIGIIILVILLQKRWQRVKARLTKKLKSIQQAPSKISNELLPSQRRKQELEQLWLNCQQLIPKLTDNNDLALAQMRVAVSEQQYLAGDSLFYRQQKFSYQDDFVEWLEEDVLIEQMPVQTIKTILAGMHYMAYFDWKALYDWQEMLFWLNRLLKQQKIKPISSKETAGIEKQLSAESKDADQNLKVILLAINELLVKRNKHALWLDEGGDSYGFFIVDQTIYHELNNQPIDPQHKFVDPLLVQQG